MNIATTTAFMRFGRWATPQERCVIEQKHNLAPGSMPWETALVEDPQASSFAKLIDLGVRMAAIAVSAFRRPNEPDMMMIYRPEDVAS